MSNGLHPKGSAVLYEGMTSDSIVDVKEAQANLNKLIEKDSFAISRDGKVVGIYFSRDRIEALVESMELLSNSEFGRALKEYESGRTKFYDIGDLAKALSK